MKMKEMSNKSYSIPTHVVRDKKLTVSDRTGNVAINITCRRVLAMEEG
jgi:hypothetical protein